MKPSPTAVLVFAGLLLSTPSCEKLKLTSSGGGAVGPRAALLEPESDEGFDGDVSAPPARNVIRSPAQLRVLEGAGPVVVTLSRTNFATGAVSIDYATADMQARASHDYTAVRGTITWRADDRADKRITIPVHEDIATEGPEYFRLNFSNVRGGQLRGSSVLCEIDDRPTLLTDVATVSLHAGGAQELTLMAGKEYANRFYFVASSLGTSPGFELGGVRVPLTLDVLFDTSLALANTPAFQKTRGQLDPDGRAQAHIHIEPNTDPQLAGLQVHHAYVVYDAQGTIHMASNSVPLALVR